MLNKKNFKIFSFFVIGTCFFLLMGCSQKINDYNDLTEIEYQTILQQPESEYYVYVFKESVCAPCDSIKEDILAYGNYCIAHEDALPIYLIDGNNTELNSDIFNTVSTGIGATQYSEVKVACTPSLLIIKDNTVTEIIEGKTAVLQKLNSIMT